MTLTTLIARNLGRSPLRTALTLIAVALPLAMYLLTVTVRKTLDAEVEKASSQLRLVVHHKMSLAEFLPVRVRGTIESLDPARQTIAGICSMTWFGGQVEGAPPFEFATLAVDHDTFPYVFSEYALTDDQRRQWLALPNAVVVGSATAKHFGWAVGDEIELRGGIPPYLRLRFRIVSVCVGPDPRIVFLRSDYLNNELRRVQSPEGLVSLFFVKCRTAEGMTRLATEIDAALANSLHPTVTEDESTFIAGFIKSTGDIPGKLSIIGLAVVFAMVMVASNTMSLAFRERTRELAVLRALGFSRFVIVRVLLCESLLLAVLGGLAGTLPVYAIFCGFVIDDLGAGPMNRVEVPPTAVVEAMAVAVAVGFVSGLVPALQAARLEVVSALRQVA